VQLEWDIDARAVPFNMSNPLISDHPAAQLQRNGHECPFHAGPASILSFPAELASSSVQENWTT
jgi:hypothetical protein